MVRIPIIIAVMFIALSTVALAAQVDSTGSWHPLQEIAKTDSNLDRVDDDGNGVIDYSDSLDMSSGSTTLGDSSSGKALQIDGAAASWSAVDFLGGGTAMWGIGRNYDGDFYIDRSGVGNAMTIDRDTLSIGIGTSTPYGNGILHVKHDGEIAAYQSDTVDGTTDIMFYDADDTDGNYKWDLSYRGNNAGDDMILFRNAGIPVMTWNNANGNVGIGMTSPSVKLHVVANDYYPAWFLRLATDTPLAIYSATGESGISPYADSSNKNSIKLKPGSGISLFKGSGGVAMEITNDGNVGIGTTSPTGQLDVISTDYERMAYFEGKGLRASPSVDNSSYIFMKDIDSSEIWGLRVGNDGDFGIHQSSVMDRLTIKNNGNVGIGTTAPVAKLNIESNGGVAERGIRIKSTDASGFSEIQMSADNSGRQFRIGVGGSSAGGDLANDFYIYDATAVSTRMVVDSSGNVGIGTTSPSQKLQVAGNGLCTGGSGCWQESSDIRIKKNIIPLDYGLDEIMEMVPVRFEWKENGEEGIGFIAQDMEEVVPEATETGEDGMMSIGYSGLVSVLANAMQEQQQQIEELKEENSRKEARIEALTEAVCEIVSDSGLCG